MLNLRGDETFACAIYNYNENTFLLRMEDIVKVTFNDTRIAISVKHICNCYTWTLQCKTNITYFRAGFRILQCFFFNRILELNQISFCYRNLFA